MMKWLLIFAALLATLLVVSFGLGGREEAALAVVGSNSVQPFAEMLAEAYQQAHPGRFVDVQGGGSTVGLQATINGIAEVGMCSRELKKDEEALFRQVVIARDGLAIVVHPSNPVSDLTVEQVRRMFTGDVVNWRAVGGEDRPIRLVVREESSGTREAFMKMVMGKARVSRKAISQDSNGAIKELVKQDACAIGFMSLGLMTSELKALRIEGVTATPANVLARRYPLVRPFLFVTRGPPQERAEHFIDFVLSPEGQAILEREGLVRAR